MLSEATVDKDTDVPELARRRDQDHVTNHFIGTDREALAAYYACCTYMDAQLGIVLDALERTGLDENTIVIFYADHGFQLGQHGLWCKNTLFEQSTQVPFIVRVPGAPANGSACHAFVELVDVFPTICDLLRIAYPHDRFEGVSLTPLLGDTSLPWKTCAFSEVKLGPHLARAVRADRYRYGKWEREDGSTLAEELYDMEADPWEQHNLAADPRFSARLQEMEAMLEAGWKAALPKKDL